MTVAEHSPTPEPPEWLARLMTLTDADQRPLEYTYVNMILSAVPADPLARLLADPSGASGFLGDLLREGSYGKILNAIEEQEAGVQAHTLLSEGTKSQALRELTLLKHTVYWSLIQEPFLVQQGRSFLVRFLHTGFSQTEQPVFVNPDAWLQVWTCEPGVRRRRGELLGSRRVHGGEHFPAKFNAAVAELLQTHCQVDEVLRLRFRAETPRGRTRLVSPAVTMVVIPALYDYLQPFYPARPYTRGRKEPRPARLAVPFQLMRDIAAILQRERPDLCRDLDWRQVLGIVHRYKRIADPGRPMGDAMFRLRP